MIQKRTKSFTVKEFDEDLHHRIRILAAQKRILIEAMIIKVIEKGVEEWEKIVKDR